MSTDQEKRSQGIPLPPAQVQQSRHFPSLRGIALIAARIRADGRIIERHRPKACAVLVRPLFSRSARSPTHVSGRHQTVHGPGQYSVCDINGSDHCDGITSDGTAVMQRVTIIRSCSRGQCSPAFSLVSTNISAEPSIFPSSARSDACGPSADATRPLPLDWYSRWRPFRSPFYGCSIVHEVTVSLADGIQIFLVSGASDRLSRIDEVVIKARCGPRARASRRSSDGFGYRFSSKRNCCNELTGAIDQDRAKRQIMIAKTIDQIPDRCGHVDVIFPSGALDHGGATAGVLCQSCSKSPKGSSLFRYDLVGQRNAAKIDDNQDHRAISLLKFMRTKTRRPRYARKQPNWPPGNNY